jgi:hypothetical protein
MFIDPLDGLDREFYLARLIAQCLGSLLLPAWIGGADSGAGQWRAIRESGVLEWQSLFLGMERQCESAQVEKRNVGYDI